eukprot:CAMPEP_0174272350 /NCGR_PEP_ID=MMETSP0439-20130205/50940_1 /TAXON_ID=0 /ORGANISM="Stereomyxa ramosa, Strain Chinc5" /LENGTH=93 /DNA_ID=CAMNT_0015362857 /DNA_START=509 /DNA_END=787 /DNA_ORIENTATION=+
MATQASVGAVVVMANGISGTRRGFNGMRGQRGENGTKGSNGGDGQHGQDAGDIFLKVSGNPRQLTVEGCCYSLIDVGGDNTFVFLDAKGGDGG